MTEAMMIKVVATGAALSVLTLLRTLFNRLLGKVPTASIKSAMLIAAGLGLALLAVVIVVSPGRQPNSSLKVLGDYMSYATLLCFAVFPIGGFTLKQRK